MRRTIATAFTVMSLGLWVPVAIGQSTQPAAPSTTVTAPAATNTTPTTPATTPPAPVVPPATTTTPPVANTAPAAPAPSTEQPPAPPADGTGAAPENQDTMDNNAAEEDDFSIGDIPLVETIELSDEKARKALDAYVLVRDKYKDAELENYENLQDFVDQSPQGKAFETDIKSFGFADVNEWNTTITSLSFAYANVLDDQTDEIKQQIEELKADTNMAQDMRDRMIKALTAMMPSDNNRKIIDALTKDAVYSEKLKQLDTEEE